MTERAAAQHVAHRQQKHRRAEDDADPEAARHVDELWIRRIGERRHARLQRHPAFRACAGTIADDVRIHRAGPLLQWLMADGMVEGPMDGPSTGD